MGNLCIVIFCILIFPFPLLPLSPQKKQDPVNITLNYLPLSLKYPIKVLILETKWVRVQLGK